MPEAAASLMPQVATSDESARVPDLYQDAWMQLQVQKPRGVSNTKWRWAIEDAGLFLDQWGSLAVEYGWTPGDLFDVPGGVVWWLRCRTVNAISPECVVLGNGDRVFDKLTHGEWTNMSAATSAQIEREAYWRLGEVRAATWLPLKEPSKQTLPLPEKELSTYRRLQEVRASAGLPPAPSSAPSLDEQGYACADGGMKYLDEFWRELTTAEKRHVGGRAALDVWKKFARSADTWRTKHRPASPLARQMPHLYHLVNPSSNVSCRRLT
jgi:hypothetical protein